MAITNYLNLAEIYRNADQGKAAQQTATLRDLQIGEAQAAQQQRIGLSDISRGMVSPTGEVDYAGGSQRMLQAGYLEPALKLSEKGSEQAAKKVDANKKQTDLIGQLAYIPSAPAEQRQALYEKALSDIKTTNPDLAAQMQQTDPVYSPATEKKIKQLQMQAITPYQRETLRLQEDKIDAWISKQENKAEGTMKASDANSLLRHAAMMTQTPFTEDAMGNIKLNATDPKSFGKVMAVVERASKNWQADPRRDFAGATVGAIRSLRANIPDLPDIPDYSGASTPAVSGGAAPNNAQQHLDMARNALSRGAPPELVQAELRRNGIDPAQLSAKSPPGVGLPERTITPSKSNIQLGPQARPGAREAINEQRTVRAEIEKLRGYAESLQNQLRGNIPPQRQQAITQELESMGTKLQQLAERDNALSEQFGNGGR